MMNNILACSTYCYDRFPFERALLGIAKAGLKYAEIGAIPGGNCEHVKPELLTKGQMREVRSRISSFGLKACSISGHCDIVSPKGKELFKKRIELASEIGAGFVNTAEGSIKNEEDKEAFFRHMKEIAEYAGENGVVVCLETHGGILGDGEKCAETLDRIGSEHVKVNYDPANLIYFAGKRPEDDIAGIAGRIGHFHIKDKLEGQGVWNFPAVGDGYIDFSALFDILYKNKYNGPLSFEIEYTAAGAKDPEEADEALLRSVRYIKKIMRDVK